MSSNFFFFNSKAISKYVLTTFCFWFCFSDKVLYRKRLNDLSLKTSSCYVSKLAFQSNSFYDQYSLYFFMCPTVFSIYKQGFGKNLWCPPRTVHFLIGNSHFLCQGTDKYFILKCMAFGTLCWWSLNIFFSKTEAKFLFVSVQQ